MKGSAPVGPEAVVRMVKISDEVESRMGSGMKGIFQDEFGSVSIRPGNWAELGEDSCRLILHEWFANSDSSLLVMSGDHPP